MCLNLTQLFQVEPQRRYARDAFIPLIFIAATPAINGTVGNETARLLTIRTKDLSMQVMGIASSILEAASLEARQFPGYRPARIGIAIGESAGVDAESLQLCFEMLTKEPEPSPIDLDISWCPGGELTLAYVEKAIGERPLSANNRFATLDELVTIETLRHTFRCEGDSLPLKSLPARTAS